MIGRATENARLQLRLAEEERQREVTRERELLSRLGRDFGTSLDRSATLEAVAVGAAPVLGGATLVFTVDDADRRLMPASAAGPDAELVEAWQRYATERPLRLGEGLIGGSGATASTREARADEIATGDPDGMRALELDWLVAVPILAGGRLQGVHRDRRGAPTGRSRRPSSAWPRPSPIEPARRSRTRSCGPTSRSGWRASRRRSASRTTSSRSSATSCAPR